MNAHYVQIWKGLMALPAIEKFAMEGEFQEEAAASYSKLCEEIFGVFNKAATYHPGTPAEQAVSALASLRDAAHVTGVKTAAKVDDIPAFVEKVAVAYALDSILTQQISQMSGQEKMAARKVQHLGREYLVEMLGALLA